MCISTANGTVYSWGGGTEGQLGHGEEVTYLCQPKPLPRSAFLGRVSLIACGDAYSAAVTCKCNVHTTFDHGNKLFDPIFVSIMFDICTYCILYFVFVQHTS